MPLPLRPPTWRLVSSRSIVLALGALVASGCDYFADEVEPDEPARVVTTERLARGPAIERVVLLGDLHGDEEVRVFSPMPERIRTLHVREGQVVAAGDPIVTLEAELQASGLDQAAAALNAAEASRDQLASELARVRGLVEQGVLPRSQLESLDGRWRAAEAQVAQLGAARRSAGQQRARTVVRAPIEGTVALLTVTRGDMTAPSAPLCSIVQLDRLRLQLRVTEQDYVRLREGMQVEVRPIALEGVARVGEIIRRSTVLDRVTRTALVEVALDNEDQLMRPGMVAEASVELSRREGVLLVPSRALVLSSRTETEREASVFVVEAGVARRRSITLGARYDRRVEVVEGLDEDDEVVVQGQHLLRDGSAVRVANEGSAAPSVARANSPRPLSPSRGEGAGASP